MDIDGPHRPCSRASTAASCASSRATRRSRPSFAHEIVNARPYAFLDDAPLEERRAHAVQTRRAGGAARPAASSSARSTRRHRARGRRGAARPARRRRAARRAADRGVPRRGRTDLKISRYESCCTRSRPAGRATHVVIQPGDARRGRLGVHLWIAAERLPELLAVHPGATLDPPIAAPASRAARAWTREEALVELLRGRLAIAGPMTAAALAASLGVAPGRRGRGAAGARSRGRRAARHVHAVASQLVLPLPVAFRLQPEDRLEWCDRRLLARIHRYTLNRLRAEIAPVTPAEFMRFLFAWQHVEPASRLSGPDGLRAVLAQLDGVELPARAWERDVLPARVERLRAGDARHAVPDRRGRLGAAVDRAHAGGRRHADRAVPARARGRVGHVVGPAEAGSCDRRQPDPAASAAIDAQAPAGSTCRRRRCSITCASRGASFAHELAAACGLTDEEVRGGARRARGRRAGQLRRLRRPARDRRHRAVERPCTGAQRRFAGRWFAVAVRRPPRRVTGVRPRYTAIKVEALETLAWTLLRRYGVVFRRAARARGGRRAVARARAASTAGSRRAARSAADDSSSGMSGEQFALPRRGRAPARGAPDSAGRSPRHDQRRRPAEPDRHHHARRSHPRRRRQPHRLPQRRAAARRWKATCCGCWNRSTRHRGRRRRRGRRARVPVLSGYVDGSKAAFLRLRERVTWEGCTVS